MGNQKETTSESYEIRLSEHALKNINEITGYIAFIALQPQNAIKVADAFYEKFESIAQNPFAFKECEYIRTKSKMYRQAKCLSWLIVYKILDKQITILGLIHSSRKPSKVRILRSKK